MANRDVWIGDLLRAYEALNASTPQQRAAIAASLRLGAPATSARPAWTRPPKPHAVPDPPNVEPAPSLPAAPDDTGAPPAAPDRPPAEAPRAVNIVGHDPPRTTLPDGEMLGADPSAPVAPPAHLPLLRPRSTRAVLQALLVQRVEDGAIDIPALLYSFATRRVGALPRQRVPTLRFGVQVLVDGGDAMAPFATDQDHLVEQVRDLVGPDRTEVRYFADAPLRGNGPGPVWTWNRTYRPPPPGTPVLILSDLGIIPRWDMNAARPAEWAAFASLLRTGGAPAVALVPYPRRRWPAWARRLFTMATWDRSLTAGGAQAARS